MNPSPTTPRWFRARLITRARRVQTRINARSLGLL
jgi:hypothetical protein